MSPSLLHSSPVRLVQLAEHAFDEEQYDFGVQSLGQLVSLGWLPSSEMIRTLMAISLCSLSSSSTQPDPNTIADGSLSRKALEAARPTTQCILSATQLLESISSLGSSSVLFRSLLPAFSDPSSSTSTKDHMRGKRSRSSFESAQEHDDGFTSRMPESITEKFSQRIADCKNIWQILSLGDMNESTRFGNQTRQRKATKAKGSGREGEHSRACNPDYDREAVWRILDVILRVWKADADRLDNVGQQEYEAASLQLVQQVGEAAPVSKRRGSASVLNKSSNVGEVFDLIFAGLAPTHLMLADLQDGMSLKARLDERLFRGRLAVSLLNEMFRLSRFNQVDEQALVRGTAAILERCDSIARQLLCGTNLKFSWKLGEAVLLCLINTASEEVEVSRKQRSFIESYEKKFRSIRDSSAKLAEGSDSFVEAIASTSWLLASPKDGIERATMQLLYEQKGKDISRLLLDTDIKALSSGSWKMGKAGRQKVTGKKLMRWDQLSLAAAWRRATMQTCKERFQLKIEVVKMIQELQQRSADNSSQSEALHRLVTLCFSELVSIGKSEQEKFLKCHDEMQRLFDQKATEVVEDESDDQKETDMDARRAMRRHLAACSQHCNELKADVKILELLSQVAAESISSRSPFMRSSVDVDEVEGSI